MGHLTAEIREFVNKTKLGFVATVCPDGTPNLSPKGTTIAWDEDHLLFGDIHSPVTVENVRHNPAIEINVVDVFLRRGFRFKGKAEILSEGSLFERIIDYFRKAESGFIMKNIVLIRVERVLPILSPAYDTGETEMEIKARWMGYWEEINRR